MSNVFILGAGFSKAFSDHMPLLAELGRQVWARLEQAGGVPSGADIPLFREDVELLLTYLSQDYPWEQETEFLAKRTAFANLQETIAEVIGKGEAAAVSERAPDWMPDLVRRWHQERAHVITLNYDTLIERVHRAQFDELEWTDPYRVPITPSMLRKASVYTGLHRPTLSLLKLHGSVNWYYSGNPQLPSDPVYGVIVTAGASDQTRQMVAEYEECVIDKVPLMVPPLVEKSGFYANHVVRTVWRLAAEALRTCERVFCVGYSLPITDLSIRYLLSTNQPRDKVDLFIVNIAESEDQKAQLVGHYREALGTTSYNIRDDLIRPTDAIPAFVRHVRQYSVP